MTDTDKLKRLAEAAQPHWFDVDIALGGNPSVTGAVGSYIASFSPKTILALIAENERLKEGLEAAEGDMNVARYECWEAREQRDEAVALLQEALEPFARYYRLNDCHERLPDDALEVPISDLARAADLLARHKEAQS